MSIESFSNDGDFWVWKQDIFPTKAFIRATLSIIDWFSWWSSKDLETIGRISNFSPEIDQRASTSVEWYFKWKF